MDSGTLSKEARKKLSSAHLDLDQHPDTKAAIAGRTLPY
jgi:hypothetical protein